MSIGDLVTRAYTGFRGVDFRGEEVALVRSPDSVNMWRNYKDIEGICTRPGIVKLDEFTEPIWGIYFYKVGNVEMQLIHSGVKLYKVVDGVKTELFAGLNPRKSMSFVYNNIWYFKDGINYLQYDGSVISEVVGYVPTTSIGRKPAGGGEVYEDVNMLTGERINTFLADGTSTEYHLDTQDIDVDVVPEVKINGATTTEFTVNYGDGVITFQKAPEAPSTEGQDNVEIRFKKIVSGHRARINNCTLLQVFDNRVFFSGNPDYPNTVWNSSLNDPTYCSDLDFYNEGLDMAAVKGLVAGNNALWVFKESSQANTTIFYHNPVIDSVRGKIYPSTHSSIYTGCVGAAINFNDDIVFFSDRGMEAINGDVTTEQAIAHRSSFVDRKLIDESEYEDMSVVEWEGYLLVFIGNHVYLADSRAFYTIDNHVEYEWFYWEIGCKVTCVTVHEEVLYIGTEDGIYTMSEDGDVNSHWTTPIDKFKHPQHLKKTNKKGCVIEASGDVIVHAKTNKSEWKEYGQYKDITDYFTSRIQEKKFKDIQLKFSTDTRFRLESAMLECFIGGYIKN